MQSQENQTRLDMRWPTMKKTEYLYGIKPEQLDGLEYWDALKLKKENAEILYEELYVTGIDKEREFWVYKALKHTEKLIGERDEQQ